MLIFSIAYSIMGYGFLLLIPGTVWVMKKPSITVGYVRAAIPVVSWTWVTNINMELEAIRRRDQMRFLLRIKEISHGMDNTLVPPNLTFTIVNTNSIAFSGGERIFSYHNRFCLAHGMVYSHPY